MKFITEGQTKSHVLYLEFVEDQMNQMKRKSDSTDEPNNLIQAFLIERQIRSADAVEKFYNDKQLVHLLADIFGAALDTTLSTMRYVFNLINYTIF